MLALVKVSYCVHHGLVSIDVSGSNGKFSRMFGCGLVGARGASAAHGVDHPHSIQLRSLQDVPVGSKL